MRSIFVILFLSVSAIITSCHHSDLVTSVSPAEFGKLMALPADSIMLIDVRTPGEFADGQLAGAINIDMQAANFKQRADWINRDRAILLYCRSGRRSATAARMLSTMGFHRIYNLEGGYEKWRASGMETVRIIE